MEDFFLNFIDCEKSLTIITYAGVSTIYNATAGEVFLIDESNYTAIV